MNGSNRVKAHQDLLLREIREYSDTIDAFERQNGIRPNFCSYYSDYVGPNRTTSAALARRQSIPAFVDRLRSRFGQNPLVLDVGCGYGTDSLLLALLGCRVTAIDANEDYVAVAQERLSYWRPLLNEAPEPQFSAGHVEDRRDLGGFQGVFSAECLHHCEPVENALLAMRGAILENGIGLVLESNAANPAVRWMRNRAVDGPRRILNRRGQDFGLTGNEAIKTPRTWRAVLHDCGFVVSGAVYTRHMLAELTRSETAERVLTRLPGVSLAAIHVAFELETRQADVIEQ